MPSRERTRTCRAGVPQCNEPIGFTLWPRRAENKPAGDAGRNNGDDGMGQGIFVSPNGGHVTLCLTGLADDAAGVALREVVLLPDASHRLPTPLGAYKFPCAMSLRICFSSERSAICQRKRAFSRSKPLQAFGLLELQPTVFLAPTIVALLGQTALLAGERDALALSKLHLGLAQFRNDLF